MQLEFFKNGNEIMKFYEYTLEIFKFLDDNYFSLKIFRRVDVNQTVTNEYITWVNSRKGIAFKNFTQYNYSLLSFSTLFLEFRYIHGKNVITFT